MVPVGQVRVVRRLTLGITEINQNLNEVLSRENQLKVTILTCLLSLQTEQFILLVVKVCTKTPLITPAYHYCSMKYEISVVTFHLLQSFARSRFNIHMGFKTFVDVLLFV